jgi:hypothetical protein
MLGVSIAPQAGAGSAVFASGMEAERRRKQSGSVHDSPAPVGEMPIQYVFAAPLSFTDSPPHGVVVV